LARKDLLNWTSNFMTFLRGKRRPHSDPRQLAADPDLSLDTALDRLRAERSGMAFIYAAMDLYVAHFELRDLVVVIDDVHEGTQIFRWGAKPISPDRKSLIAAAPGVYSYPDLNDGVAVDLLFARCRQEFDDLRSSGDAATGASASHADQGLKRIDDTSDSSTALVEPEVPQIAGSAFGVENWRLFASKVFVYVTVANIVLALFDVTGSVRFVLGLVLGLAIPGWSVVGLIHFRDTALEIALSMAASIAIVMASAQLMITLDLWHLEAYEVFLCLVCLPSLLYQSKWDWFRQWLGR
jgi:hypothetical protein